MGDIEVVSSEEVLALVRAAENDQDGVVYMTAAFTGLRRGELLALRWRDVDFPGSTIRVRASYAGGEVTTSKSGRSARCRWRRTLRRRWLGSASELWTGHDDLFVGEVGGYLDGSALRRRVCGGTQAGRPAAAALSRSAPRVRHTDDRQGRHRRVQEWMGHEQLVRCVALGSAVSPSRRPSAGSSESAWTWLARGLRAACARILTAKRRRRAPCLEKPSSRRPNPLIAGSFEGGAAVEA